MFNRNKYTTIRNGFRNPATSRHGIQRTSVPVQSKIQSKIIKDLGYGKVSIMGKSYDKKIVENKMKEVDEILKTMSLPEIKKKYGI